MYLTFKHISPPRLSLNYQNQTRNLSAARGVAARRGMAMAGGPRGPGARWAGQTTGWSNYAGEGCIIGRSE